MALTIVTYRLAEDGKPVSTFAFEPSNDCLEGAGHV